MWACGSRSAKAIGSIIIPASLDDFAAIYEANPNARIVAGSTMSGCG